MGPVVPPGVSCNTICCRVRNNDSDIEGDSQVISQHSIFLANQSVRVCTLIIERNFTRSIISQETTGRYKCFKF